MIKTFIKGFSRGLALLVTLPLLAVAAPLMYVSQATTWLLRKLGDWALLGRIEDD